MVNKSTSAPLLGVDLRLRIVQGHEVIIQRKDSRMSAILIGSTISVL